MLYLYRPHKFPWHGRMLRNFIFRKKQAHKYAWLALEKDCYFFCGLDPWSIESFFGNIREIFEIYLWVIVNRYSLLKVRFSIHKDQRILFFVHKTLISDKKADKRLMAKNIRLLKSIDAVKIAHITHYFYGAEDLNSKLQEINAAYLTGESDPRINACIENIIGELPFQKLPFKSAARFVNKTSFKGRKNRVVATGTIAPPICDDFFKLSFGTDCLQPDRLDLVSYVDSRKTSIDCYIDDLYQGSNDPEQKAYFGMSLPDLYNQYRYCLVTSEIVGFPQIAIYEATSSGCVLIALNDGVMEALGFEAGVSYLQINNFHDVESVIECRTFDEDTAVLTNAMIVCSKSQLKL